MDAKLASSHFQFSTAKQEALREYQRACGRIAYDPNTEMRDARFEEADAALVAALRNALREAYGA